MDRINTAFIYCLLCIFPLASLAGANYYVHPELGKTDHPGTSPLLAFRQLDQLRDLPLQPGDSILLAAGYTYPGTIELKKVSGSSDRPVVIGSFSIGVDLEDPRARIDARGYGNGILIIDGSHIVIRDLIIEADGGDPVAGSDMRCGVLVQTQEPGIYQDISLHRLHIKNVFYENPGFERGAEEVRTANGSQRYGWGIRFINRTAGAELSNLQVTDCVVENVAHTGIKFTGQGKNIRNLKLYNNRVLRTGGPGIQMSGVQDGHISHNYVSRSGSPDDSRKWGRGSGLWTWGSSEVIIEHNHFLHANGPGDSAGCHIDFNCNNVIVQYNFSAGNAGGFCEILGNNYNCAYRYNISVNDGHRVKGENGAFQEGKIFWLSGYQGNKNPRKGPFNSYFYNNTIFVDTGIVAKIAVDRAAQGVLIANNIFYIAGQSKAVLGDQYRPEEDGASQISEVIFRNNLYLQPDNWPRDVRIQDEQPMIGDPDFLRPGGSRITDYVPANRSAVQNRGMHIVPLPGDSIGLYIGLGAQRDILGTPISGLPDLGAIELPAGTSDRPAGAIIHASAQAERLYFGTPSIVAIKDKYVVSHNTFGPAADGKTTFVFHSLDGGRSWQQIAKVEGIQQTLFKHRDALYLLGPSGVQGKELIIRKSEDGGHSWTAAAPILTEGPYHTSATPVIVAHGRIWKALEDDHGPPGWGSRSRPMIISAPVDADLLDPSQWRASNQLTTDQAWAKGYFNGLVEGNAVLAPDRSVKIILRADFNPNRDNVAAMVQVDPPGKTLTFEEHAIPSQQGYGFFNLPGATKKFVIRYDTLSGHYWALTSWIHPSDEGGDPERTRNTLALVRSRDLVHWELRTILLHHPDVARHGYHYADWQFEGEDIIAAVRTAWNGKSQHDSNMITFHRFSSFRSLTMKDAFPISR